MTNANQPAAPAPTDAEIAAPVRDNPPPRRATDRCDADCITRGDNGYGGDTELDGCLEPSLPGTDRCADHTDVTCKCGAERYAVDVAGGDACHWCGRRYPVADDAARAAGVARLDRLRQVVGREFPRPATSDCQRCGDPRHAGLCEGFEMNRGDS